MLHLQGSPLKSSTASSYWPWSRREKGVRLNSVDKSTVEPFYCGHLGDLVKCPVYREKCMYSKFILRVGT